MRKTAKQTEAGEQYAVVQEAHHKAKDLAEAIERYRAAVMDAYPRIQEAECPRSQIQNITDSGAPKQEFLDIQVEPALVNVALGSAPNPDDPSVTDSSGGVT